MVTRVSKLLVGVMVMTLCIGAGAALASTPVEAKNGMVAAAHPLASQVGVEILKKGGNAVDAAIATAFALGVVEPNASGLGGGGFMLVYNAKTKAVTAIDYREMAPLKATPDMYKLTPDGKVVNDETLVGHKAVAIPGTLAGLTMALKQHGTMSLKDVMAPAIRIAEEGYTVSKTLNAMMKDNFEKLSKYPAAAAVYLKDGLPYDVGDKLVLKDLAKSYRLIAEKGPDVFYKGEIADAIEKEMQQGKGLITKADLAIYKPAVRTAVRGTYRGHEIISMSPPSSGGTHVVEILNILEGFNMTRLGYQTPESLHVMAEAMKRAFADRAKYMADTDFVKVPIAGLISKEYAAELRKGIRMDVVGTQVPAGNPLPFVGSGGTSHLSVIDKQGNIVALTQTINMFFGSGVLVPGTGIMLNDEMDDFNPKPGTSNSIEPKKRPLSSMTPTIVLKNGKPFMSLGSPGATRIISALTQIIVNVVDFRMNVQDAIDAPRIHCMTGDVFMESRIPQITQDALKAMGHKLNVRGAVDLYFGGAQAVMIDPATGKLYGAGDPRRDGVAVGY